MDAEERKLLSGRLCNEARNGEECIQRKTTAKMVWVDGYLRHKVCAEVLQKLQED